MTAPNAAYRPGGGPGRSRPRRLDRALDASLAAAGEWPRSGGEGAAAVRPVRATARDVSRDGVRNRIEVALLTGFRPFWRFVNRRPRLARFLNGWIVNSAAREVPARPLALSTVADYTSWTSLTDRTWFARYLPPRCAANLPPLDEVAALFKPGPDGPRLSKRSTLLFPCFAQWFTDGFMMTDGKDRRRTGSSHQIDLGQLYGMTAEATAALRLRSETAGRKGRLKSVVDDRGEEWAPRLYDDAGTRQPEFTALPEPARLQPDWPAGKKATLFAFGGERANTTPFTAAINTLFLREHNRLCKKLEEAHPNGQGWDDERVFQTARNVNIVQLIKIVVEEYINHISPFWFRLLGDPTPCYKAAWNRQNWVPVEFNLLYRWHSLVPEEASWGDAPVRMADMRHDNHLLLRDGLTVGLGSASRTKAWQIGLFNTARFLQDAERASIQQGRDNGLASYNDYREAMGYPRVTEFGQISGDPCVVEGLRRVYGHVDRVEFFAGLFAEEPHSRSAVPGLIGRMVAADAFSHALTNPLLSPSVFGSAKSREATFTAQGVRSIEATSTLRDLLARNSLHGTMPVAVSMEQDGVDAVA